MADYNRQAVAKCGGPLIARNGGKLGALPNRFLIGRRGLMAVRGRKRREDEIFERQARICKAFAHPSRLRILDLLSERERGVSDLQREVGISKAGMSQQIAILRSAGVLVTRRDGKQIYCSLAIPEVKEACKLIRKVLIAQITDSDTLHESSANSLNSTQRTV